MKRKKNREILSLQFDAFLDQRKFLKILISCAGFDIFNLYLSLRLVGTSLV